MFTLRSAAIVIPNHLLSPLFGKVLFICSDMVVAWLLLNLLRRRGVGETASVAWAAWFLFNPFTVSVSTRGSHDTLVCALVLTLLLLFQQKRYALAGAVYVPWFLR